jgi:hypothetical protein
MRYTDLFENDDEDMFGPSDADLFGGRSPYKMVQKLLRDPANVIEMRFMKGSYAINQCIGAQDLDGHPYLFGKSLKNPNSKARLSWPWSKNMDMSTRVVHLGPNHYAIVLKSTTLKRGNKYQGMPFVAEENDDDLFGTSPVQEIANEVLTWIKDTGADPADGDFDLFDETGPNAASDFQEWTLYSLGEEFYNSIADLLDSEVLEIVKKVNHGLRALGYVQTKVDEEQSDDDLFGARKMYYVNIMGNWNTGRYSDYGARRYIVPGSSPEGAITYLKNNEDLVYAYLDGQKFTNGKRVVRKPARQHVFLDNSTVFGTAPEGSNSAIERFIRKHRAL